MEGPIAWKGLAWPGLGTWRDTSPPLMGVFIDGKGAAALKAYKYSGSDLSLTYKYILSPMAQKCVDLVSEPTTNLERMLGNLQHCRKKFGL